MSDMENNLKNKESEMKHLKEKHEQDLANLKREGNENIEKYKNKSFNFNEDYKIINFFNDSRKYNEIVNCDYNGLSFKDMMEYKEEPCIYEKEFNVIDNYVNNCDELTELIYKYEGSQEYQSCLSAPSSE